MLVSTSWVLLSQNWQLNFLPIADQISQWEWYQFERAYKVLHPSWAIPNQISLLQNWPYNVGPHAKLMQRFFAARSAQVYLIFPRPDNEKAYANLEGRQILMVCCCVDPDQVMTMDRTADLTPIHRHYILHHVAICVGLWCWQYMAREADRYQFGGTTG